MKNTRKISLIVIHCSATRVTQDFTFEKLEACHLARGFRSIGYHYYITKDGVIYPDVPSQKSAPTPVISMHTVSASVTKAVSTPTAIRQIPVRRLRSSHSRIS